MQPSMEKNHFKRTDIDRILDSCKECVLSTVGDDGFPYGTPVNYVRDGDRIYFHGRMQGEKVDNLRSRGCACLTVMIVKGFEVQGDSPCGIYTNYESVIVRGKVNEITDRSEKRIALSSLVKRLAPHLDPEKIGDSSINRTSVFALSMDSVTGKYHHHDPENAPI